VADFDRAGKPDVATFESPGANTILRLLIGLQRWKQLRPASSK
jgi:hypothetical protein